MTEDQFKRGKVLLIQLDRFKTYKKDLIDLLEYDSFDIRPNSSAFSYIMVNKEDVEHIIKKEIEKTNKSIKEIEEDFKNL